MNVTFLFVSQSGNYELNRYVWGGGGDNSGQEVEMKFIDQKHKELAEKMILCH